MPRPTPVRAPATRDQADAYRFGLRRLEAALVRGDPVPLHEQIRSQRRAALAGVALGLLGLCGAALYATLGPGPADWRNAPVVEGADSGSLYAVANERLVPVPNLTAARLVLAAAGAPDAAGATAVEVPDADLATAPRAAAPPVPGAVGVQPAATVTPSWALCDETTPDGIRTTLIGGAAPVAANAPADGVLLDGPDGETWLVAAGRRHLIDGGDVLQAALGRSRTAPRPTGTALLALLPQGPDLATPTVPDRGDRAPEGLPGRVGDVLAARVPGGVEHFVVLRGGLQPVPGVAAELLRAASGARAPREVGADVLADARIRDDLDLAGWPATAPRLLDPAQAPAVCWTWSAAGDPSGQVWIGAGLPLPPGVQAVPLGSADGPGGRVDAVAVGAGGAVLATGSAGLLDAAPDARGPRTPDRSDPDRSDPDRSDPDRSDPDRSDADSSDPDGSRSDRSDADGSGPDRSDVDGSDPGRPDLDPDRGRSDGSESDSSDLGRSDSDGPDTSRSRSDGSDPDGSRSDGSDPESRDPARSASGTDRSADEAGAPDRAIGSAREGDPDTRFDPVQDGQVWLISDTGLAYPVADDATARALGIVTAEPAPAALLGLLPPGPLLDVSATAAGLAAHR